ncbi:MULTISPECIES: TetR family transcriptional regulator [unclassified Nocardiopsis]|uniref:TetR/AcrR family transcriptional regulator n=1 Tax=Nocardiopsis TaxID=2013 RepID=UPI00387B0119
MTTSTDPAPGRRGRRPGTSTTRQNILDTARARFAEDGFAATTIRRIAADAGVDASLVIQFFRSKNELFAAVMSVSPDALARFSAAFDGPAENLGERVVRAYLGVWEGSPEDSEPLMAMLRGAISNEQARAQLGEFIEARLIDAVGPSPADPGDAALRAGLASSMLVGIIVGRRVVGVPTLAEADTERLVAVVAPAIQSVLVSGAPPTGHGGGGPRR